MQVTPSNEPRCTRPDLADDLPRWDRLGGGRRADLETHASGCHLCGPRLELLKHAEAWLAECGVNSCPPAELLYDFGGGPGHLPLPDQERARVAEHLAHCATCDGFVDGLADAPPPPLELEAPPLTGPLASAGPRPLPPRRRTPRSAESWARVLPLTAAAALFLFVALWNPSLPSGAQLAMSALDDLPRPATLRGASASALLAPRSKLLALADAERGGVPARPLVFEIAPPPFEEGVPAPTGYRVRVFARDEDPFEKGELIAEFVSAGPLVQAPDLLLTPGGYSWEAWVMRGTVESSAGELDFDLIVDTPFLATTQAFEGLSEPLRTVYRVTALHEAGYESDARALVRGMRAGPARDSYLEAFPAR